MKKRKDPTSKFFLIFGLVAVVMGLPFVLVGRYMLTLESRYENDSKLAKASVLTKRVEESRDKDNRVSRSYVLEYSFSDDKGQTQKHKDSVALEFYDKTEIGQSVDVQYLPDSVESNNRVLDGTQNDSIAGWLFLGMGGIVLGGGLFALVWVYRRWAKVRRLETEGMLTDGQVTRVAMGSLTINNVTQYQINYTFPDHWGKTHAAVSEHMPPEMAERWKAGDKGKVRFDKKNPAINMWVGD